MENRVNAVLEAKGWYTHYYCFFFNFFFPFFFFIIHILLLYYIFNYIMKILTFDGFMWKINVLVIIYIFMVAAIYVDFCLLYIYFYPV